jgi:predicted MFS family arabinose efflux permease
VLSKNESPLSLPLHWRAQLAATTLARVLLNIAIRMIYPFMPEFSRSLQVPQETLVFAASARYALSTSAPLFAGLPERFGQRRVMLFAMALFLAAVLLAILLPGFPSFVLLLFAASTAKNIYDPSAYSYWSERSDYSRRGLVMALYETSWSISFLLGMPAVGWLMARNNAHAWQYPLWMMAGLGLMATLALSRVLQNHAHHSRQEHTAHQAPQRWRSVLTNVRVWSGLAIGFLASLANENLLVILGAWLETKFGMSLTALGFASFIIGIAELAGEGVVMILVDRLGKRRAVAYGLACSALAFALLHALALDLGAALLGLFVLFLTFEFTLVATLPLMSELVPGARAQTMSLNATMLLLGRMIGALAGGFLFKHGLVWNLLLGASLNLLALAVLQWGLRGKRNAGRD